MGKIKPKIGISMEIEEFYDKISKNLNIEKDEIKKVIDAFIDIFAKKLKLK